MATNLTGQTIASTYEKLLKRQDSYSATGSRIELQNDSGAAVDSALYLDITNQRIGIGDATPIATLQVHASENTVFDGTSNSAQNALGGTLLVSNQSTTINSFAQLALFTSEASGRALGRIACVKTSSNTSALAFVTETGGTCAEKMRILGDGNVGIGTTTPQSPLHIKCNSNTYGLTLEEVGVGDETFSLKMDGGGHLQFEAGTAGDLDSKSTLMTIKDDGNVGIGTATPTYELDVAGDIGVNEYIYHNDDTDTYMRFSTNQWLVRVNGDDRITIPSSGNVGIGTASPDTLLDLEATNAALTIQETAASTTGGIINLVNTRAAGNGVDGDYCGEIFFKLPDDGGTTFTAARILGQARETANAGEAGSLIMNVMHDAGTPALAEMIGIRGGTQVGSVQGSLVFNGDSKDMDFDVRTNGVSNSLFVQGSSGNVGIGTASPGELLHIYKQDAAVKIRLQKREVDGAQVADQVIGALEFWTNEDTYNPGSGAGDQALRASIQAVIQDTSSGTSLQFLSGASNGAAAERMRINAAGKVGINQDAPTSRLEVVETSTTGTGFTMDHNPITTTGSTYATSIDVNKTGVSGDGATVNVFGLNIDIDDNAANHANSTTVLYGLNVELTVDNAAGTSTAVGVYSNVTAGNADTKYSGIFMGGNVGIGTAAPGYKLSVADSTTGRALQVVQSGTSGTTYGIQGGAYGAATKNVGIDITAEGASTNYAAIFQGGNVGIGTTAPTRLLHIYDVSLADGEFAEAFVAGTGNSATRYGSMGVAYNSSADTNAPCAFMRWDTTDNVTSYMWVADDDDLMGSPTADHIGKAGSGTAIPDTSSDERLKNISSDPFPYGLEEINKLKPIKFSFKKSKVNKQKLGFGAQTTKPIIPEVVNDTGVCIDGYTWEYDEDGNQTKQVANSSGKDTRLSMSYNGIIPVLVKAVQELTAKVEALENK